MSSDNVYGFSPFISNKDKNMKKNKIKVLFVCLGNICRSPSAEAVFLQHIQDTGKADFFEVDSAGLIAAHQGEKADSRMRQHAFQRGYRLESLSRPITYDDFFTFDYIICMDDSNLIALKEQAPDLASVQKISKLTDWADIAPLDHVPDPYYGGARGFEEVLDLLELCIPQLSEKILQDH